MDARGEFAAALLDASARALAAGAAARFRSGAEGGIGGTPFGELVAEATARLTSLAEALATGRPEVWRLDVEWLRETHVARGVPACRLPGVLAGLRDELAEALPAGARERACVLLEESIAGLAEARPPAAIPRAPDGELARALLGASLAGRRAEAERVAAGALAAGASVAELHAALERVQAELGRRWQAGEIGVAEEHLGSRVTEAVLHLVRERAPRAQERGRTALTASVAGNLHDIGARMVADRFELAGWRSLFLGADTPAGDLGRALEDLGPDLVALSVGLGTQLRAAAGLVAAVRARTAAVVLVGGRPFRAIPDLWRDVGADGAAPDAAGAVEAGERLVGR